MKNKQNTQHAKSYDGMLLEATVFNTDDICRILPDHNLRLSRATRNKPMK